MDQPRARSPSAGHHSPQNINNNGGLGIALDPSLTETTSAFANGNFASNPTLGSYNIDDQFMSTPDSQFASEQFSNPSLSPFENQQPPSFTQDLLDANLSPNFNQGDFPLFPVRNGQVDQFEQALLLDDASTKNQSVNPADIMSDVSSPPGQGQTPPGMLQPDMRRSPSAQQSPNFNQHQFQSSPAHSRNTSLGPESAAFPQGQPPGDWSMMTPHFAGHRRTPSEYSDRSSVAPSPNLPNLDSFDGGDQGHSPMVSAQDAGLYQEVLGIGNFSLSDQALQGSSPRPGLSPAHSPAISPRIAPQSMSALNQQAPFMLNMNNDNFGPPQMSGIYGNQGQTGETFPTLPQHNGDLGLAPQMVPPEINVVLAPASRQNSFEPPKPSLDQDALTPPDRSGQDRGRRRALSDPYHPGSMGSRPGTPASGAALRVSSPHPSRSLSPLDRSGAASPSNRRRQSTSALPNRDYILGLADPDYQPASGSSESAGSKRVQKHPATFQCTLCPKRFTRAYNLRSHLRTHTDERPFVCTVCGKAFARQHDRKRHEGLHSGEKKFVCKGDLKQGGQWGCGRRFARADALGRHFRSEAGRICIKPLLEEETIERQRMWQEQQMQNMAQNIQQPQPVLDANGFPIDTNGNYSLPAALLAQYPALATLSWSELPQGEPGMDEDPSGRSSFDASGSEYYDEGDEAGYVSGPGASYGQSMNDGFSVDYTSDYGGQ